MPEKKKLMKASRRASKGKPSVKARPRNKTRKSGTSLGGGGRRP